MHKISNIVLVHGGFVDGSGWAGVYGILKRDGFNVSIVQNPTLSLAGDVAAAKLVILHRALPLASLLLRDDHFEKAYEDRLSIVFVARRAKEAAP